MHIIIDIPSTFHGWSLWWLIPTMITVALLVKELWPKPKRHYDGPAAGAGLAMLFDGASGAIQSGLATIVVLVAWLIALVIHFVL